MPKKDWIFDNDKEFWAQITIKTLKWIKILGFMWNLFPVINTLTLN